MVAATHNPSQRGERPYHCSDCFHVRKIGAISGHWVTYSDAVAARVKGHPRACKSCLS
jgi:hypothetical protein